MRSGLRLSAPCRSKDGEEISGLLLPRRGSACSPMAVESVLVLTSSRCWGINTNYQTLRYFTTVNEPPTVVFTITDAHDLHVICTDPYSNQESFIFLRFVCCHVPCFMKTVQLRSPWSSLQRLLSNTRATEERLDKLLGDEVTNQKLLRFQLEGFFSLANDWRSDQPESRKLHARLTRL